MNTQKIFLFEGMSGTKKTAILKQLLKKLKDAGKVVSYVKEFPDHGLGKKVYTLLKKESKKDAQFKTGFPKTEFFLFLAMKSYQIEQREKGPTQAPLILEDRGTPSILGYYLLQKYPLQQAVKKFEENYALIEKLYSVKPTIFFVKGTKSSIHLAQKRDRTRYSKKEKQIEKKIDLLFDKVTTKHKNWVKIDLQTNGLAILEKLVGLR